MTQWAKILWTCNLLAEQTPYTIYEDNKSTIKLLENRILSSSKQTRHLNVRNFHNRQNKEG